MCASERALLLFEPSNLHLKCMSVRNNATKLGFFHLKAVERGPKRAMQRKLTRDEDDGGYEMYTQSSRNISPNLHLEIAHFTGVCTWAEELYVLQREEINVLNKE